MTAPIPRTLEAPPRTTGNAQQDLPILIDWFYRAYQVIQQSVNYINDIADPNITIVENLPDPDGTTLAQAQQTANDAYSLGLEAQTRLDGFIAGTVTISDADTGFVVTFGTAQVDTSYRVMVQAVTSTGTPTVDAFVIKQKTYTVADFTVTMFGTPGVGNSITFEWQLIRNS